MTRELPPFTENDLFLILTYLIDASDPRIGVKQRNELLEKAQNINSELTIIMMGNMLSGLFDRVADVIALLEQRPKEKWIEEYLIDMRKNTGTLPVSKFFED